MTAPSSALGLTAATLALGLLPVGTTLLALPALLALAALVAPLALLALLALLTLVAPLALLALLPISGEKKEEDRLLSLDIHTYKNCTKLKFARKRRQHRRPSRFHTAVVARAFTLYRFSPFRFGKSSGATSLMDSNDIGIGRPHHNSLSPASRSPNIVTAPSPLSPPCFRRSTTSYRESRATDFGPDLKDGFSRGGGIYGGSGSSAGQLQPVDFDVPPMMLSAHGAEKRQRHDEQGRLSPLYWPTDGEDNQVDLDVLCEILSVSPDLDQTHRAEKRQKRVQEDLPPLSWLDNKVYHQQQQGSEAFRRIGASQDWARQADQVNEQDTLPPFFRAGDVVAQQQQQQVNEQDTLPPFFRARDVVAQQQQQQQQQQQVNEQDTLPPFFRARDVVAQQQQPDVFRVL